jgi:hypothetical protein
MCAFRAPTLSPRRLSVTSVFILFPATKDTEKSKSPQNNNLLRISATTRLLATTKANFSVPSVPPEPQHRERRGSQ